MGPQSLDQAMELAVKIEDKLSFGPSHFKTGSNSAFGRNTYQNHYTSYNNRPFTQKNNNQPISNFSNNQPSYFHSSNTSPRFNSYSTPAKPMGEIRRLRDKEVQQKREKGLCFRCDEKWTIGHKCAKKELSVLFIQEEEEEEKECEEEVIMEHSEPEISLNSVMGITSPKTIKMVGTVNGEDVIVMIDPGATHNFISLDAVERLGVPVISSKSFGVSLGTGDAVEGEGECKDVQLQGVVVKEDFLPLPLGNSNLILGIQWLEKLGTMTTNWKTQTIQFMEDDRKVTLRGDPALGRTLISLKAMIRTLRKEGGGFLVEFNHMEGKDKEKEGENEEREPEFVQELLQHHEKVFNMPEGLPHKRGCEHAILLKEGTDPVSVRPYKYPQSQKDEIERWFMTC